MLLDFEGLEVITPYLELVPEDFKVPLRLESESFRLRMLTVRDLVIDYDAVMTSVEHLRATYSAIGGSDWPVGLTLEDDLIDLGWHQCEFNLRRSFAYTVVSLDESRCLGCVYLNPTAKLDYDVEVTLWVRESELETGLDDKLHQTVKTWLELDWPFRAPPFPLREIPLDVWRQLPTDPPG